MPDNIYELLSRRHLDSIKFSMQMGIAPEDFKSLMQTVNKTKEQVEAEWVRQHPSFPMSDLKFNSDKPPIWYIDDVIPPNTIYMVDGEVISYMYEELWLGIKHNKDCRGFRNRKDNVR